VLGMTAILLASALVLASCGPNCSSDGDCVWDVMKAKSTVCDSKDCAVYKAISSQSTKVTKCDC
jgi:hypothetical protein